ncbi:NHL repeat-containing protein [Pedobacter namyangjuensis]|uniref:ATP-binding protein n=1 Tax=Pedobacter namyangjuensis TaxID=600626 RepID=UPI000DE31F91|nr:ATP-binding protein [Pedobacter namyangjuensis]
MRTFLSVLALLFVSNVNAQTIKLEKLWEAKEQLPVPESVVYVAEKKELYVSLIDGEGNVKDGKGGVAILNLDGSVKNATWITGLNAPKGMAIYKGKLYVADITAVVCIDLSNGKIIEKIEVPNAIFLNDIAIDKKGVVYVSDTRTNKIHRIANGQSTVYLENVMAANGLKFVKDDLYALAGPELIKFDKNKNKTVIASGFEKSGDGLERLPNGDFLVTCWAGIIYHVRKDGTKDKLLDVQGKMNTADIGFDPKANTLWVPTFNANSVVAYQLKYK